MNAGVAYSDILLHDSAQVAREIKKKKKKIKSTETVTNVNVLMLMFQNSIRHVNIFKFTKESSTDAKIHSLKKQTNKSTVQKFT